MRERERVREREREREGDERKSRTFYMKFLLDLDESLSLS